MVAPPPNRGEIWWAEAEDNRCPLLVVSRGDAVEALTWTVGAPVTRIRHIPTEVALGAAHGLQVDCVASFDDLKPIRRTFLPERVGRLGTEDADEIGLALRALGDR